jgi:uncharacterized membrane protein (DUF106 family)
MEWFESFIQWVGGLGVYASIFVLLISFLLVIISMIVNHLVTDVDLLGEHEIEIKQYTQALQSATRKNDRSSLRSLRKREQEIRELQSFVSRQRMKVSLITMGPFMLIFILLNLSFSSIGVIATLPFDFPFIGRNLFFNTWYIFCYFTAYLPLSRVFHVSVETQPIEPKKSKKDDSRKKKPKKSKKDDSRKKKL